MPTMPIEPKKKTPMNKIKEMLTEVKIRLSMVCTVLTDKSVVVLSKDRHNNYFITSLYADPNDINEFAKCKIE